jgi:membrane protein
MVGLLIALYSGVNWMGNLREAIRAQSRDVWERTPQDQEKIWVKYLPRFCFADWPAGGADCDAFHYLRRRFRAADDYLRALS